ncbi:protein arginine N-methyltransferase 9-like [Mytilus edulis]|uniref:protein arginine N-methyltransferase 9-like n=1 Tax=Mytilus edulis TaxID=6550 RepID=UPI0039F028C0
MSSDTSHISKSSLSCAKSFLSKKKYGRSFANFLLFLKLSPHKQSEVIDDFIHCMTEWTNQLISEERIDDLFKCYDQACEILPDCESILNNIGAQLFRLGYIEEAALYIRRSIQINPDYTAARQNLENVCSHLVERWHFRMLNDVRRNCAYRIAIRRAAQRGHRSVLDIGSGTGILSLFAMKAGIPEIHACEKSKTMCEIANDVFRANKAQDTIDLICKTSTDILIPDDIPDRVSLVVTETFDAALFGENIVSTVQHALQNLMIPVDDDKEELNPTVIPCGATIYVCPIECETIRNKNRFLFSGLQNVDIAYIPIHCTTGSRVDPYTTENLSTLRGSYKPLADPVILTKVNFTSLEELDILCSGIQWDADVDVTKCGKLDAIALWFDLHLDEDISISTDPTNKNCWEQAIYPVLPSNFCYCQNGQVQNNYQIRSGSKLHLCFTLDGNYLHLNSCQVKDSDIMSCDVEMAENFVVQNYHDPVLLERTEISKLNNLDMNRIYCQAIEKFVIKGESENVSVLDMCLELSLLTIQLLKQGISHATVLARKEVHNDIIRIAMNNDLDLSCLFIEDNVRSVSNLHNLLVCDIIDTCGALRQQILEDIALLRVTSLTKEGRVLPGRVTIHGVCVESVDLQMDSAVINDEVTLGFTVAKFMNDFQMTTHVDIDLLEFSHRKLSSPFELLTFDLNEEISEHHPPSFLKMENKVKVVSEETGQVTAVVYWFEFELYDGIHFTTLDTVSHWKQAAIMMKPAEEPVLAGQELTLHVTLENSCLNIKMESCV